MRMWVPQAFTADLSDMSIFQLDAGLAADTLDVMELEACSLRLLNDRRWPWLVLIPKIHGAVEWHDLSKGQRIMIDDEVARVAGVLKTITSCSKINIASLGNMVRQLHVHVIARSEGDPNWPGPVWGFGDRQVYGEKEAAALIDTFKLEIS